MVRRDGRLVVGDRLLQVQGPARHRQDLALDYAVVMRRLRGDDTLAHRIATGIPTPAEVADVGRLIAAFHAGAHTAQACDQRWSSRRHKPWPRVHGADLGPLSKVHGGRPRIHGRGT